MSTDMKDGAGLPRRKFLKSMGAAAATVALQSSLGATETSEQTKSSGEVPRRKLGKTGEKVSIIGMGGHTLALAKTEEESIRMVHEAVDGGITFMDNAWEYHDGRSETVMGKGLKGRRDKVFLMTKVCTHGKGKDTAMKMLEESLGRLQTDHLDLWMIHMIMTEAEIDSAYAGGGVIEALELAKKQGKIRYTGFTGHKDPNLHLGMIKRGYAFDAVLMPINCFEPGWKGFRTEVLPEVNRREMGSLGIKSLGGSPAKAVTDGKITAREAIRFALSQPITVQIVGMSSLENVRENLETVRNFKPMSPSEMEKLTAQFAAPGEAARYAAYLRAGHRDGACA
jgi:uncharacterized protein